MANESVVTLIGNLTREPELRFTPSGQATASFGIAVNKTWTDRQTNEKKEATSFFDVVAWGTLGENVATSLTRGTRVVITGRFEQRSWENQDGERRSKVEVTADAIGPDLRWSTVTVTKNERRHGTEVPNEAPQTAAPAPAAPAPPAQVTTQWPVPGSDDEEPF